MQDNARLFLSVSAVVASVATLAAAALSLGTEYWVVVSNSGDYSDERFELYPRHYGLILECFNNITTTPKGLKEEETWKNAKGEVCHYVDYQFPAAESRLRPKASLYFDMMRAAFGLDIAAVFLLLLGTILLLTSLSRQKARWFRASSALTVVGAVALLACLILFHVKQLVENQIDIIGPVKEPILMFPKSFDADQQKQVRYHYGWSYALAWVGVGMAWLAICPIHFLIKELTDKRGSKELLFPNGDFIYEPSEGEMFYPKPQTAPQITFPPPPAEEVDPGYHDSRFSIKRPNVTLANEEKY